MPLPIDQKSFTSSPMEAWH